MNYSLLRYPASALIEFGAKDPDKPLSQLTIRDLSQVLLMAEHKRLTLERKTLEEELEVKP